MTQVIGREGKAVGRDEATKLSRKANKSTTIVYMDSLFLSNPKAILKYACAFELQYGVSFAEPRFQ